MDTSIVYRFVHTLGDVNIVSLHLLLLFELISVTGNQEKEVLYKSVYNVVLLS